MKTLLSPEEIRAHLREVEPNLPRREDASAEIVAGIDALRDERDRIAGELAVLRSQLRPHNLRRAS